MCWEQQTPVRRHLMNKLAIFVEGWTELQFADRLITEIAGVHHIMIQQVQLRGGTTVPRRMKTIRAASVTANQQYFVLIVDCGSDVQVKTRIVEEHEGLTKSKYSKI